MKILKYSLLSILLMTSLLFACNRYLSQRKTVPIADYRNENQFEINLDSHKNGDVVIYQTNFPFPSCIGVTYYHDFNGELEYHSAFYGPAEGFNKASYFWKDDTTVAITLINTETKQKFNIEVWGNENSSALSHEE